MSQNLTAQTTTLSPSELERYARHIVLRPIGGPGQHRLKQARVLVIGCGGLGAPVIQYLAAAGVGTLRLVDDDVVSLSNLQRQVIHDTRSVGRPKVESAREAIARLNPHTRVEMHDERLTTANAAELLADCTVAIDCTDNFDARYVLTDAAALARVPVVTAAVNEFDASITTLRPFDVDASGAPNPGYRDLYPQPPPAGMVPSCAEAGVMGALLGIVGAMQALEATRQIVGFGESLVGKLLLIDAMTMRFETIGYGAEPA